MLHLSRILGEQFRRIASALTRHAPEPKPAKGKRTEGIRGAFKAAAEPVQNQSHSGETRGSFALAAKKMLKRQDRSAFVHHAVEFVADTLEWLHLWGWNDQANDFDAYDAAAHDSAHHDYSLHL